MYYEAWMVGWVAFGAKQRRFWRVESLDSYLADQKIVKGHSQFCGVILLRLALPRLASLASPHQPRRCPSTPHISALTEMLSPRVLSPFVPHSILNTPRRSASTPLHPISPSTHKQHSPPYQIQKAGNCPQSGPRTTIP